MWRVLLCRRQLLKGRSRGGDLAQSEQLTSVEFFKILFQDVQKILEEKITDDVVVAPLNFTQARDVSVAAAAAEQQEE